MTIDLFLVPFGKVIAISYVLIDRIDRILLIFDYLIAKSKKWYRLEKHSNLAHLIIKYYLRTIVLLFIGSPFFY